MPELVSTDHRIEADGPTPGVPLQPLLTPDDRLKFEIWPKSLAIWMVAFYMALFLIRPWEKLSTYLATVSFERFYILAMLSVVALERGVKVSLDRQTIAVLTFLAALLVSALQAFDANIAWFGANGIYGYLPVAIFFFVLICTIRTPYELVFLAACHLVAAGTFIGKSLWEHILHGSGALSQNVWRMRGINFTFGHPNRLAACIVLSIILWYFLYATREYFTASWPEFWKRWYERSLHLYPVVAFASLVLTKSRGGIVGIVVVVLLSIGQTKSSRIRMRWIGIASVFAIITWFAIGDTSKDRIVSIFKKGAAGESAEASREGRIVGMQRGWEMFQRFPIVGVGPDNYIPYRVAHMDGVNLASHNLYAQVLGQTGFLGACAFAFLIWTMLRNAKQLRGANEYHHTPRLEIYNQLGVMCRNSVIVLLCIGLFSHNLFWHDWLWLAAFSQIAWHFAQSDLTECERDAGHHAGQSRCPNQLLQDQPYPIS